MSVSAIVLNGISEYFINVAYSFGVRWNVIKIQFGHKICASSDFVRPLMTPNLIAMRNVDWRMRSGS